jgi:predicted Zn-dependent protease
MSKTYEDIKELDDKQKNNEEELDEIDILVDTKQKKPNLPNFFKFFLVLILLSAIYSGYYLAGKLLDKSKIVDKKSTTISSKEEFIHQQAVTLTTLNFNKKDIQKNLEMQMNMKDKDNIVINNITLMLCELGKYKEALSYAENLIIKEPNNPYYWNTFGIVLTYLDLFDDAEKSFKKAISLKADEGVFYYNLGNLYERNGKFDMAKEQYLNYLAKGDRYNSENIKFIKQKMARGL